MDKLFSGARPTMVGLNVHQPNSTLQTRVPTVAARPPGKQ